MTCIAFDNFTVKIFQKHFVPFYKNMYISCSLNFFFCLSVSIEFSEFSFFSFQIIKTQNFQIIMYKQVIDHSELNNSRNKIICTSNVCQVYIVSFICINLKALIINSGSPIKCQCSIKDGDESSSQCYLINRDPRVVLPFTP